MTSNTVKLVFSKHLRQVLAYTGKFTLIWLLKEPKLWPLERSDCLIQAVFKTGLSVHRLNMIYKAIVALVQMLIGGYLYHQNLDHAKLPCLP